MLNYAPLNFDLCLLDVWSTLKAGGRVVLVDHDQAMNPRYLVDLLASSSVNVVQAVPILYRLLLDASRGSKLRFETVEHVIFTGYAMPPGVLAELPALFPRARFHNVYGCTETNDSFIHEVDARRVTGPVPIGRPLPGVEAFIVDASGDVAEGACTGELYVATPSRRMDISTEPLPRSSAVNSLELRTHCAQRLPRVAIPSALRLTAAQLPRATTGKVDRQRIKDMLLKEPQ